MWVPHMRGGERVEQAKLFCEFAISDLGFYSKNIGNASVQYEEKLEDSCKASITLTGPLSKNL